MPRNVYLAWRDIHATAVESGDHLRRCLAYIDLNMVRAGRVAHPLRWAQSGYYELHRAPRRRDLVDYSALLREIGIGSMAELKDLRKAWVEGKIALGENVREPHWTESIAVGSREFLDEIKERQGTKTWRREIANIDGSDTLQLRDSGPKRNYCVFKGKKAALRRK